MSEFMAALFNTSFVAGACTAVFLLFFSLWGKNYGAGCRKTVWLLIAVCCLLPFRLPVRGYSVAIPEVVIRRGTAEHLQNAAASGDIAAYLAAYLPQGASDRLRNAADSAVSNGIKRELTTTDVFFAVWACAGVGLVLYYTVGHQIWKRKILRQGQECADPDIRNILQEEARQCGLKKVPRLYLLKDSFAGPFTVGVLRSTIVLPNDVEERDLRFILRHELLHCKRKDILRKLFFLSVNLIHWFNPLIWLLRKAAEQDIEIGCDEAVVSGKDRTYREEYSDVIMAWVARSNRRWSAVSTGYVQGVRFVRRRFDSIINGSRKKGRALIVAACVFPVLVGSLLHIQSGGKVYAVRDVPIDYGIEIRTDLDGDGKEDTVFVKDTAEGGRTYSQVIAKFHDGHIAQMNYPDSRTSYLVTGDVNGDGLADIVVNRASAEGGYGSVQTHVLHVERNRAGVPELTEYTGRFIENLDLEIKWAGRENEEGEALSPKGREVVWPSGFRPEDSDFHGLGATIFERDGKTMLRIISCVDLQTETVQCIECSYTPEGWYIEEMTLIRNYWTEGWNVRLLGNPYLLTPATEE